MFSQSHFKLDDILIIFDLSVVCRWYVGFPKSIKVKLHGRSLTVYALRDNITTTRYVCKIKTPGV